MNRCFIFFVPMVSIGALFSTGGCDSDEAAGASKDSDAEQSDTDTGEPPTTLKDKYADYFLIGAAADSKSYTTHADLLKEHFSSITAENEMKWESLQRSEGNFTFITADRIVDFARKNDIAVRGHALVWHRQTPSWVFKGEDGEEVSPEVLLERMRAHITEVMTHFKGRVEAWDVVNEAMMNDGRLRTGDEADPNQNSPWYAVLGEQYIAEAFKAARAADPNALLFYNDYYNYLSEKRDAIYALLKGLLDDGVPVDGVGLQCHIKIEPSTNSMDQAYYQTAEELEKAIELYASLGLTVHVTEMDVSLYSPNVTYTEDMYYTVDTFTDEVETEQAERYAEFFDMFRKHKDAVSNVTFWGIADDNTWLSERASAPDRLDFPLIFDVDHEKKKAFDAIFDF